MYYNWCAFSIYWANSIYFNMDKGVRYVMQSWLNFNFMVFSTFPLFINVYFISINYTFGKKFKSIT